MQKYYLPLSLVLLTGCQVHEDDLNLYTQEVLSRERPFTQELPKIEPYVATQFVARGRDPFTQPKPEALIAKQISETKKDCPQPLLRSQPGPLEKLSLNNIRMQGTLKQDGQLWALVNGEGGHLYRVKEGDYIGLHSGQVINVGLSGIDIKELVADGKGCWQERITQVNLATGEKNS